MEGQASEPILRLSRLCLGYI